MARQTVSGSRPDGTINVRASGEVPVHHGDTVWLTPDQSKLHRFDASGAAINA